MTVSRDWVLWDITCGDRSWFVKLEPHLETIGIFDGGGYRVFAPTLSYAERQCSWFGLVSSRSHAIADGQA